MAKNTILLIDDDENICKVVTLYLEKEGYDIKVALDGRTGLDMFFEINPDLVLLDIMMPGMDGIQVIKQIRQEKKTPVIMLTAKGDTFDKVLALELGADDYIVKPFEPKELIARIKAVMRRTEQAEESVEKINKLDLPPKELELLYFLAQHPNRVFTREQLLQKVWEFEYCGDTRTVDVHIKRLREKLSGDHNWQIKTVWGVGYKFEVV